MTEVEVSKLEREYERAFKLAEGAVRSILAALKYAIEGNFFMAYGTILDAESLTGALKDAIKDVWQEYKRCKLALGSK
ncbi:MAG: hypothetical protein LM580_11330 [Thermofilum sp.]|nr:hypothetical protein [Thermofilum sp.]